MLSLGAGVQSSTLLLMALQGGLPDCAIFADTGWEPQAVYDHLDRLEANARADGLPVHRVSAGNFRRHLLDAIAGSRRRVTDPPLFVPLPGGGGIPPAGSHLW